uniref:Uncharacterized protein n=1 Tax=Palpitomonas bilix TaxID=652834 RepID=A0A7S3LU48_9EUKA
MIKRTVSDKTSFLYRLVNRLRSPIAGLITETHVTRERIRHGHKNGHDESIVLPVHLEGAIKRVEKGLGDITAAVDALVDLSLLSTTAFSSSMAGTDAWQISSLKGLLVKACSDYFREDKKIRGGVYLGVDPLLPEVVRTNVVLARRLITELLSNAVLHSGGGDIRVSLVLLADGDEQGVSVNNGKSSAQQKKARKARGSIGSSVQATDEIVGGEDVGKACTDDGSAGISSTLRLPRLDEQGKRVTKEIQIGVVVEDEGQGMSLDTMHHIAMQCILKGSSGKKKKNHPADSTTTSQTADGFVSKYNKPSMLWRPSGLDQYQAPEEWAEMRELAWENTSKSTSTAHFASTFRLNGSAVHPSRESGNEDQGKASEIRRRKTGMEGGSEWGAGGANNSNDGPVRRSDVDKNKGLGLGLPACRRICVSLGGDLSMMSTVGLGTTATCSFAAQLEPANRRVVVKSISDEGLSMMDADDGDVLLLSQREALRVWLGGNHSGRCCTLSPTTCSRCRRFLRYVSCRDDHDHNLARYTSSAEEPSSGGDDCGHLALECPLHRVKTLVVDFSSREVGDELEAIARAREPNEIPFSPGGGTSSGHQREQQELSFHPAVDEKEAHLSTYLSNLAHAFRRASHPGGTDDGGVSMMGGAEGHITIVCLADEYWHSAFESLYMRSWHPPAKSKIAFVDGPFCSWDLKKLQKRRPNRLRKTDLGMSSRTGTVGSRRPSVDGSGELFRCRTIDLPGITEGRQLGVESSVAKISSSELGGSVDEAESARDRDVRRAWSATDSTHNVLLEKSIEVLPGTIFFGGQTLDEWAASSKKSKEAD